jgi:hypothetical protein
MEVLPVPPFPLRMTSCLIAPDLGRP